VSVDFGGHDLDPAAFPIDIEFRTPDGEVVHRIHLAGPGFLYVPPLTEHGPVSTHVRYGDGTRLTVAADGTARRDG
jgi:hypothetical protein